jgi:hypothetical protein
LIITHPQLYVLNYSKNNLLHIDISIRIKDYDNIYIDKYSKNMYGINMDDLFPLQDNIFENIKIKIPYNSKKYLENIYGVSILLKNNITILDKKSNFGSGSISNYI